MRLKGVEPPHMAPETIALSTELQAHSIRKVPYNNSIVLLKSPAKNIAG